MVLEIRLGDVVRLRKVHPCGGYDWEVYRLGADIGLRCLTCGRHVLIARSTLEKRIKEFLARGVAADGPPPGAASPPARGAANPE
jgi:hypothetical protein